MTEVLKKYVKEAKKIEGQVYYYNQYKCKAKICKVIETIFTFMINLPFLRSIQKTISVNKELRPVHADQNVF